MVAVLVSVFGLVTRALIDNFGVAPSATVPTFQRPVLLSYVPWLTVAVTNVKPAGSRSTTRTLVAVSGPLLIRRTTKVVMVPTLGVALVTDLVIARLACCGVSVALALLFVVTGSN